MPRIERSATVTWDGNVARGAGRISGDTGAFTDLPFSLPARIGRVEGKTSPEELLASAHAGCLGMGLASELANPDARVEVRTTIRMDEVDGKGHQIVASTVAIRGRVPGLSAEEWQEKVAAADAGCPFSTLLKNAGVEVTVNAELEEGT
ncbi:MAG: OsmC family peroxiredoxin [Actinobacteria bacterium]|nr:MAG: OsmC family peroxiredoxin [Actinomycetota bacterium]